MLNKSCFEIAYHLTISKHSGRSCATVKPGFVHRVNQSPVGVSANTITRDPPPQRVILRQRARTGDSSLAHPSWQTPQPFPIIKLRFDSFIQYAAIAAAQLFDNCTAHAHMHQRTQTPLTVLRGEELAFAPVCLGRRSSGDGHHQVQA